jgi:hypothetical protein
VCIVLNLASFGRHTFFRPSLLAVDWAGIQPLVCLSNVLRVILGPQLRPHVDSARQSHRLPALADTSNNKYQALIKQLIIKHWKYSGWIRWLCGTREQCTIRRDLMIKALGDVFDLEDQYDGRFTPLSGSVNIIVGAANNTSRKRRAKSCSLSWLPRPVCTFGCTSFSDCRKIGNTIHVPDLPYAGESTLYNHPAYDLNAPPKTPAVYSACPTAEAH